MAFKGGFHRDYIRRIVDQEIDEEKGTATVNVKVTYGNGDTEENKMKMLKKDGDWVLSADK